MQKVIRVSYNTVKDFTCTRTSPVRSDISRLSLHTDAPVSLVAPLQDDNNAPVAKATASTPPSEAGYILEYEHGQVRNGTAAVVGST